MPNHLSLCFSALLSSLTLINLGSLVNTLVLNRYGKLHVVEFLLISGFSAQKECLQNSPLSSLFYAVSWHSLRLNTESF